MAMERLFASLLPGTELGGSSSLKACCADLYAQPLVRWLLGHTLHPGGAALTRRLAGLMELHGGLVLDVATGSAATPRLLAEEFGCRSVGIDLSVEGLRRLKVMPYSQAVAADAERLPFVGAAFDAAVCECSFCLLPDKKAAAREFRRVLRPGGRLGITDVTLRREGLGEEFRDLLAWAACVGDARPMADYARLLQASGLRLLRAEEHNDAMAEMLASVGQRLLLAETVAGLARSQPGLAALGQALVEEGKRLVQQATALVEQGRLGYCLLVLAKDGQEP